MYIQKQLIATPETVADGEYTATVKKIRFTKKGDSLMFICSITTPGLEGVEVLGFCKPNWNKPTGRTTANLYAWTKNLGGNLIEGQEDQFNIEDLQGKDCRIIVQSYVRKTDGVPAVKVANILPFNRSVPNPMAMNKPMNMGMNRAMNMGMNEGSMATQRVAPQQHVSPQAMPIRVPTQQAPTQSVPAMQNTQAPVAQPVQTQEAAAPSVAPVANGSESDPLW